MRGRHLLIPQFLQCLKRGDVAALTLLGAGSRISSSENLRLSAASVLHFPRVCGLRRMVGKVTSRIRGSKVIPAQMLGIAGPVMSILQDQRENESKSDCMVKGRFGMGVTLFDDFGLIPRCSSFSRDRISFLASQTSDFALSISSFSAP